MGRRPGRPAGGLLVGQLSLVGRLQQPAVPARQSTSRSPSRVDSGSFGNKPGRVGSADPTALLSVAALGKLFHDGPQSLARAGREARCASPGQSRLCGGVTFLLLTASHPARYLSERDAVWTVSHADRCVRVAGQASTSCKRDDLAPRWPFNEVSQVEPGSGVVATLPFE